MRRVQGAVLTALVCVMGVGCGPSDPASKVSEPDDDSAPNDPNVGGPEPGESDGPQLTGRPGEAIFVSSSKGVEGAEGSSLRPVQSIAEGLMLAKEKHLPVVVCAEPYAEAVSLADGVGLYGYFDCTDLHQWRRTDARAKIVAPTSPAVVAVDIVQSLRFEGFEVVAPDMDGSEPAPNAPANSSIAMLVRRSKNVTLTHVSLQAGKGQDGGNGEEPAEGNAELSSFAAGRDAYLQAKCGIGGGDAVCNQLIPSPGTTLQSRSGGLGGSSQCRVGPNGGPGGRGGAGPIANQGGGYRKALTTEANGEPALANGTMAVGGYVDPNEIPGGRPGASGAGGSQGAIGTHGKWTFDERGEFVPGNGSAGGNGTPGQGGGGGAGSTRLWARVLKTEPLPHSVNVQKTTFDMTEAGASGAGGGAGGCGGLAGSAGRGGGASLGLVVIESELVWLSNVRIAGGNGGRGGKGSSGTSGTPGHKGGATAEGGVGSFSGSAGGRGGDGGAAGLSGHGAPGPSIALVFKGARPHTEKVELDVGKAGEGGPELKSGPQTLPAVVGVAKLEHAL